MDLQQFFQEHHRCAIAFSGGVDSSYLLYAAKHYGADVKAYYVKAAFQPQFELDDAVRLSESLKADMKIIRLDVLSDPVVRSNPKDRCYYCKQNIFQAILSEAKKDGYTVVLDGTNASDDINDRPGFRALQELKVLSPLRLSGLTKDMIRSLSKEAGLFTWNKPAYACLATRIPSGEEITEKKLEDTEVCEGFLFDLGFTDFRVRRFNGAARLELRKEQLPLFIEKREEILKKLKEHYSAVLLDLEVRS
ncbi:MAG: ATP-dependent sacrificial sulfur transferase LarE [Lachnospiraceae bacterium]|nr:ATP-dependent sacrificial sulfur transferase LarE [Lachnospiraceae bacterium]